MVLCSCSFSCTILSIAACLAALWIAAMLILDKTPSCKEKSDPNCLKPEYLMNRKMQV